jgi:hypothetical protein
VTKKINCLEVRNISKLFLVTRNTPFSLLDAFFDFLDKLRVGSNNIINLSYFPLIKTQRKKKSANYLELFNRARLLNVAESSLKLLEFLFNLLDSLFSLGNLYRKKKRG